MNSTWQGAVSVLERFPEKWHVIVDLSRANEDFRELCNHHTECNRVLARLRAEFGPVSDRIKEYEELILELEQEIRNTIDAAV